LKPDGLDDCKILDCAERLIIELSPRVRHECVDQLGLARQASDVLSAKWSLALGLCR